MADHRELIQDAAEELGYEVGLWLDEDDGPMKGMEGRLGRHRAVRDASETFKKGDEGTLSITVRDAKAVFMMLEDGEGTAHEVDPTALELVSPTPFES